MKQFELLLAPLPDKKPGQAMKKVLIACPDISSGTEDNKHFNTYGFDYAQPPDLSIAVTKKRNEPRTAQRI